MNKAIYAGSFDPITVGHMDIVTRAAKMFDELYIVIMKNAKKSSLVSEVERKQMIDAAIKEANLQNVYCEIGEGLTVEYAKKKDAKFMIRGLRASMDFEYELQIANANTHLIPDIETVFLTSRAELSFISSTIVKDVAQNHGNLKGLVPDCLIPVLEEKYK